MTFHTDHAFRIGEQHLRGGLPCQDYALSGTFPGGAFAVVSDGCSSGGHTDVGARVVALAAARSAKSGLWIPQQVLESYADWTNPPFGLDANDMLATCVWAVADGSQASAGIMGDGVIAFKLTNGETKIVRLEWANNAPAYPAYNADSFDGFAAAQGGRESLCAAMTTVHVSADGLVVYDQTVPLPLGTTVGGHLRSCWAGDVACVAAFSDGVAQIDGVGWKFAVHEMLSFKTTAGAFARRRMHRFVDDCRKNGRGPIDDVAFAVILVGNGG